MTEATIPRTHLLVVWTPLPDERVPMKAAVDDLGRLIAFSELETAQTFADRLAEYGMHATPFPVSTAMVAELLGENGTTDDVIVFEAQTEGAADALRWASQLADRLVAKLAATYGTTTETETGT